MNKDTSSDSNITIETDDSNAETLIKDSLTAVDKIAILMVLPNEKKDYLIAKYFKFTETSTHLKCTFMSCGYSKISYKKCNLLQHLARLHFLEIDYSDETVKRQKQENADNFFKNANEKKRDIEAKKSRKEFIDDILDIILSGMPFKQLEGNGFKNVIKPYEDGLNMKINRFNISEIISKQYNSLKKDITKKVANKMLSIKIDGTSVHNKYYIGINCQFFDNSRIRTVNLGIVMLEVTATSMHIKEKLKKVLTEYKIETKQIYSITSDNAANYLKVGRLLNNEISSGLNDIPNLKDYIFDIIEQKKGEGFDEGNFANLESSIANVEIIPCGVHSLQLAVYDSIKELPYAVCEARAAVKKLRTHNMTLELKKQNLLIPPLDVITRWSSTYHMIERLVKLRSFMERWTKQFCEFKISEEKWTVLYDFLKIYKPVTIFTTKCQKQGLLLSDFVIWWMDCERRVMEIETDSPMKKTFLDNLRERQKQLFKSPIFYSAIFLDNRYKELIIDNDEIMSKVKNVLEMALLKKGAMEAAKIVKVEKEKTILMKYSNSILGKKKVDNIKNDDVNVTQKLQREISIYLSISSSENVCPLNFWKNNKSACPLLHDISVMILGSPSSQVSVESAFSILKWFLESRRSMIGNEKLNQMCVVKLNTKLKKELHEQIKQERKEKMDEQIKQEKSL